MIHLADTPFAFKQSSRTRNISWKRENLIEHMKTVAMKIETEMQDERIFPSYKIDSNEPILPGDPDSDTESDSGSQSGEKDSLTESQILPKRHFEKLNLFEGFELENKSDDEIIEDYIKNYKTTKWYPKVFERIPIKYFRGDQSIFPFLGETQAILNKKCPTCNVSLMNYESFNSSFKKKLQSLFKEYSPIIKVYRIFKHPSIDNALVYQFYAYNLTDYKISIQLVLDNEASEGAKFDFGEGVLEKTVELDRKKDCQPRDRSKVFKMRFQVLAYKDPSFRGIKTMVSAYNIKLFKEEDEHELKTKMVLELGDSEDDRNLCLRYRHQFKYRKS